MDRPLRRARDSYTEQVQIIMPQHVNARSASLAAN